MAAAQTGVWGIDLGQSALKALRLEVIDGEIVATAFDYVEHPKILSQPDADPDQLTRQALEQFLSRNQIKGDVIAISVPGQTGLARFVKLPPVEAKKIPDIVRFEARQQIPFPLDEVVWDWQTLGTGGDVEGFVENEIGLFAMKRDMVSRYLQSFKDVNVEVHVVQMAPLALCNYATYDVIGRGSGDPELDDIASDEGLGEKNACVVILDMGADSTNLVVTDAEKIIWQRPIPIGGNHFTRALTKEMKLTFAKAEHLKRHATKAEDPKKIFQALKPVFSDFVGELTRSLGFFTNTHRQAQIKKMIGLGNAFRLPGLQKFVGQSMNMELEKILAFRRLRGDEVVKSPIYSENVLSFAVAYGLALQGLQATRLRTNLMPKEIQMDRIIRSKKPWVAAAVTSMLAGLAVFSIAASGDYKVAKNAADAAKNAQGVLTQSSNNKKAFTDKQDEMKKAREAAVSMMRGAPERANWPLTLRYVNECLPQPNGANLPTRLMADGRTVDPASPAVIYWTDGARRAAERLRERDEQGLKDEINLGDLIQINVQSIWARYCNTTMATNFFNNVRADAEEKEALSHPDWQKAPAKDGWAFEVRGYTYHDQGLRFVMDTFMENLRSGRPRRFDASKNAWVFEKGVVAPLNDPSAKWVPLDISHVAVLVWKPEVIVPGKPQPDWVHLKRGLYLNSLVDPKAGAAGGGMASGGGAGSGAATLGGPGDMGGAAGGGGAAGAKRTAWSGLGTALGGSSSSGMGGTGGGGSATIPGGATGGGGSANVPPAPAGGGGSSAGIPSAAGGGRASSGAGSAAKLKSGERRRTEFILVFYWVEPLFTEPDPKTGYDAANNAGEGGMSGYPGGYGYPGGGYPGGYGSGPPSGGGGGSGGRSSDE